MRKITLHSVLLLSFFFFQNAMAQQKPAVLNHIAVYVSDLNKSTAFYCTVFNLKEIPEPFKDGKHTWFSLGNAGALHLIQGAKGHQTFDKNEHLCFSVSSIDVFTQMLSAKNIPFEDWAGKAGAVTVRVDGVKQVYFKDPDGHWLETNDAK